MTVVTANWVGGEGGVLVRVLGVSGYLQVPCREGLARGYDVCARVPQVFERTEAFRQIGEMSTGYALASLMKIRKSKIE